MKRDNYIKPETTLLEIKVEAMIAVSFTTGVETKGEAEAPKRRGEWGNVWSE